MKCLCVCVCVCVRERERERRERERERESEFEWSPNPLIRVRFLVTSEYDIMWCVYGWVCPAFMNECVLLPHHPQCHLKCVYNLIQNMVDEVFVCVCVCERERERERERDWVWVIWMSMPDFIHEFVLLPHHHPQWCLTWLVESDMIDWTNARRTRSFARRRELLGLIHVRKLLCT